MMRGIVKSIAAVGLTAALAACNTNEVTLSQQADGSVRIVDSEPAIGGGLNAVNFFRDEGRTVARICAAHEGNDEVVGQMLVAAGYVEIRDLFNTSWGKRSAFNLFASPKMDQDDPCNVSLFGYTGREFMQGAEASLIELGYSPIGSSRWSNGTTNVRLTGRIETSSATGTSSTVVIERY
ncbi:hypothetical protein [Cochlodiniinecator piscidefendens]|uniref:hypothetical protein n=1 Tax=Cochlodiniinecator piscidefendens TaxID=2715756 RepID=UPI00140ABB24|nr:hypothetical protein [Cochlodiniinecator piscidefendens]